MRMQTSTHGIVCEAVELPSSKKSMDTYNNKTLSWPISSVCVCVTAVYHWGEPERAPHYRVEQRIFPILYPSYVIFYLHVDTLLTQSIAHAQFKCGHNIKNNMWPYVWVLIQSFTFSVLGHSFFVEHRHPEQF